MKILTSQNVNIFTLFLIFKIFVLFSAIFLDDLALPMVEYNQLKER